jgi:hypothetical protein
MATILQQLFVSGFTGTTEGSNSPKDPFTIRGKMETGGHRRNSQDCGTATAGGSAIHIGSA